MKRRNHQILKTALVLPTFLWVVMSLQAQYATYWVGGTPGAENAWHMPQNWSHNRVPTEDTHVVIQGTNSGHNAMPVIRDIVEVASIQIHSGGELRIENGGEVVLNGESAHSEGLICYGGRLINHGVIKMRSLDAAAIANVLQFAQGDIQLWRDGTYVFADAMTVQP